MIVWFIDVVINETQMLAKRIENEDIESGSVNVNCAPGDCDIIITYDYLLKTFN